MLALIALHGLETVITSAFGSRDRPQVVVYADDFVVLHPTRAGIEKAQHIAEEWLSGIGLRLKTAKTRITHTRLALDGPAGFEFLGFHIRRYVTKEHRPGSDGRKQPVIKTLIKPSKDSVKRHHRAMRDIVRARKTAPHEALISALNPVIRGWSMYYRTVVAKKVFASCDYRLSRRCCTGPAAVTRRRARDGYSRSIGDDAIKAVWNSPLRTVRGSLSMRTFPSSAM